MNTVLSGRDEQHDRGTRSDASSPLLDRTGFLTEKAENVAEQSVWVQRIVAIICVVLLVANTIGQAQYARISYSQLTFSSYYFLCWFTNAWLVLLYPCFAVLNWAYHRIVIGSRRSLLEQCRSALQTVPDFTVKRFLLFGIALTLFNFFSTYTWYMSLSLIPVAINASLYKSSVLFIFLLSVVFLRESLTVTKLAAVALSIAGLVMIGIGNYFVDPSHGTGTVSGYALILASAFMTSCYEVLLRRLLVNARGSVHHLLLLLSIMGLYVCLTLWWPVFILRATGVEPPVEFSSPSIVVFLFVNMLLAVSYYVLYAFGIAFSSAVYMSVSGMLSIPVAGVVDALIRVALPPLAVAGMAGVFIGVLVFNVQMWAGARLARCAPWLMRDLTGRMQIPERHPPASLSSAAASASVSSLFPASTDRLENFSGFTSAEAEADERSERAAQEGL